MEKQTAAQKAMDTFVDLLAFSAAAFALYELIPSDEPWWFIWAKVIGVWLLAILTLIRGLERWKK